MPLQVGQQCSSVVGRPAQMPCWSFGFQLSSFGDETLEMTEEVAKRMEDSGFPLEVKGNGFYCMHEMTELYSQQGSHVSLCRRGCLD